MWTPAARRPDAEALHRAAEAAREADPRPFQLDPDAIAARVFAKWLQYAGADDADWRPGFDHYVASARDEGRLGALGARHFATSAGFKLNAHFAIADVLQRAPEIAARRIDRPIFITGGWRTGTTLLQRLLAAIPGLRGAFPSELTSPWRFHNLDQPARDALVDAGAGAHAMLHVLNPAMKAIHPSGGRLAEECNLAMGTDFRNWSFPATLRCPSYVDWLTTQDMTASYRRYADMLRILDDGSNRRWILKAPVHSAALDSLLDVFPDARVIHLHRDVVQTVTSGASLFAVFRSTYSDAVDAAEVGRYQLGTTALWTDRAMAVRDRRGDSAFIDLPFAELVADPKAAARRLCAACDIGWSDAADTAADAALVDLNAQHGAHRYTPADFGLDPDEIRARLARYATRFGIG